MELSFKSFYQIIKKTFKEWSNNDVSLYGASVGYYTIFSVGPLITIVIWLLGKFLEEEAITGQVYSMLSETISPTVAHLVQELVIKSGAETRQGAWATLIGIIITLYSATQIVIQIKNVLDKIWGMPHERKKTDILKKYAIGFASIFGIGIILLLSGVLNVVVKFLGASFFQLLPFTELMIKLTNNFVLYVSVVLFIAAMFKYLPNIRARWRAVLPGAIFTTTLFFMGKVGFSWYMSKFTINSTFGAASSLVVFLMWIYFSAQIIFFGAQFTKEYAIANDLIKKPKVQSS